MAPTSRIAIIGHNGWAAQKIIKTLAAQPFQHPLRVLAREGSSIASLPDGIEVRRYSWDDEASLTEGLKDIEILCSFIGHEGLKDQRKLVKHLQNSDVKLFAPSDLALPYTSEEREQVEVPREKEILEHDLDAAKIPFVTILIGNMTSFAFDSPYMGIDIPNNRILHTGNSRTNLVWLCSLDYVAAGVSDIFLKSTPESLAGRTIGLNELRPTTGEMEDAMKKKTGVQPKVADDTVENALRMSRENQLDALVRKKMGDGTHGVGDDIWEVEGFKKRTLVEFISGQALEVPKYQEADEGTRHFLDAWFA